MLTDAYKQNHRNASDDGYYLYTNEWSTQEGFGSNGSVASFVPSLANEYYYYQGDAQDDGNTWLYTEVGGVYTLATTYEPGVQYYTQSYYFDQNAGPAYLVMFYEPVDSSVTISGTDGQPYIAPGTPRFRDRSIAKTANLTGTLQNSFEEFPPLSPLMRQQVLGNNGRIEALVQDIPDPPNPPNPPIDDPDGPDNPGRLGDTPSTTIWMIGILGVVITVLGVSWRKDQLHRLSK